MLSARRQRREHDGGEALSTPATCDEIRELLPAYGEGTEAAPPAVRDHVERCLRCQADLVQYRRVLRTLHHLRTEVLEPAPGLVADVLAHMEEAGERTALRSMLRGRRAAYVGGLAAATAAGAAGAAILLSRRRLRLAS